MSVSPALMPQFVAPTIRRVLLPENKRRRAELERNFDKALRQRAAHRNSKGYVVDEDAFLAADRRVSHVQWLINKGIAQGRWDA